MFAILLKLDPLIRSLRSLLKDLTKSLTKVKSGDLSIMHDNNREVEICNVYEYVYVYNSYTNMYPFFVFYLLRFS